MDDVKELDPSTGDADLEVDAEGDDLEEGGFTPKLGKDGKPIPYNKDPRWQKVYKGFKDSRKYETLGTPEKLQADLQKLAYYEGLLADVQEEGREAKAGSKEEEDAAAREAGIKKELEKLFPALKELERMKDSMDLMYDSLRNRAEDEVTKVCKELGIRGGMEKGSPRQAFASVIADLVDSTPELLWEYMTNPRTAVREAVKTYQKMFKADGDEATRKAKADLLKGKQPFTGLPKGSPAPAGGGSPEVGDGNKEPRSIKEATANIKAKFKALREQGRV